MGKMRRVHHRGERSDGGIRFVSRAFRAFRVFRGKSPSSFLAPPAGVRVFCRGNPVVFARGTRSTTGLSQFHDASGVGKRRTRFRKSAPVLICHVGVWDARRRRGHMSREAKGKAWVPRRLGRGLWAGKVVRTGRSFRRWAARAPRRLEACVLSRLRRSPRPLSRCLPQGVKILLNTFPVRMKQKRGNWTQAWLHYVYPESLPLEPRWGVVGSRSGAAGREAMSGHFPRRPGEATGPPLGGDATFSA